MNSFTFTVYVDSTNVPACELCLDKAKISNDSHDLCDRHWNTYLKDPDFFGKEELK